MRVPAIIRWPGKVPAGLVTQEMLAAVDWMPTLAGMVGASDLIPKDRPIDGIDASAFMLGQTNTTGRGPLARGDRGRLRLSTPRGSLAPSACPLPREPNSRRTRADLRPARV